MHGYDINEIEKERFYSITKDYTPYEKPSLTDAASFPATKLIVKRTFKRYYRAAPYNPQYEFTFLNNEGVEIYPEFNGYQILDCKPETDYSLEMKTQLVLLHLATGETGVVDVVSNNKVELILSTIDEITKLMADISGFAAYALFSENEELKRKLRLTEIFS